MDSVLAVIEAIHKGNKARKMIVAEIFTASEPVHVEINAEMGETRGNARGNAVEGEAAKR